jgi:thymidylate synthase (FAD)
MTVTLIGIPTRPDGHPPIVTLWEAAGICVGKGASQSGFAIALESGHLSLLEHLNYTFRIEGISRSCLAQLTRHRFVSLSVESQRYCGLNDQSCTLPRTAAKAETELFTAAYSRNVKAYNDLVSRGVPMEDARLILPEGTHARLILTTNCRELLRFFELRCCNKAQWEIRELANAMLALMQKELPEVFQNAGAPCKRGKCPEKKPCGNPQSTPAKESIRESMINQEERDIAKTVAYLDSLNACK